MNDNNSRAHEAPPVNVELTEELATRLFFAQLEWTKTTIESYQRYPGSDDGRDYLDASLELSAVMSLIQMDEDLDALNALLNTPNNLIHNYACDGIAPAFYELNCPALPADDEFYDDEGNPT